MLKNTALRLLRRLLGSQSGEERPYESGTQTLLDGATAIAVTEALVSESAGLSASAPLKAAELAWRGQQQNPMEQGLSQTLSGLAAEGPRGALAAAIGQAMAGLRATCFVSGPDLATAQDLVKIAVGHRIPLVIHLGLRGLGSTGSAPGTGHEALHLATETGALVLVAANVQEAVDFTLIARRTAEQLLLPVIVAQDGEQTALAIQDLYLPSQEFLQRFLGNPNDQTPAATSAQQFLFGETRRRLPRWYDADRPILLGSPLPIEIQGLSQAGSSIYLDSPTEAMLGQILHEFSAAGGKTHRTLSRHRLEDADIILLAQGSAIETAEIVCEQVRTQNRLKVGVMGIRCIRPFPAADMVQLVANSSKICVLERLTAPLSGTPPVFQELKAAINRYLDSKQQPKLISVPYGLGGSPLRAEDLAALCKAAPTLTQPQIFLGLKFAATESPYPKRQVLLDQLRRDYPNLDIQGLGKAPPADLRPAGCITLSLHRLAGGLGDGLIPDAAALLQQLLKGGVRCRPSIPGSWGSMCIDRISVASVAIKDPGDCPPADIAILTVDPARLDLWPVDIAKGGSLIIVSELPNAALLARLPIMVCTGLEKAGVTLYRLPAPAGSPPDREELLGAICSVLLEKGKLDVTRWRLLAVQDALLGTASDRNSRIDRFTAGLDAIKQVAWPNTTAIAVTNALKDYDTAPELLRRGGTDSAYDSLSRFWDQVGVLYARGDTSELVPDPYLAIGTVPAHSAALRDLSGARTRLPALDPTLCSGCGACWSVCPDGAWGASVLSIMQILDAGMRTVGASALRPLVSKIAAAIARQCQSAPPTGTLDKLLESAFATLYPQLPFPEDRKAAMAQEVANLLAAIGSLPVVTTDALFRVPEAQTQGQGALLALALNSDACKGCAMCITVCTPGALGLQWQDASAMSLVQRQRQAWDILPVSDQSACARLRQQPGLAPLGAALLAPGAGNVLSGGDGMEPGSGARLAIRLTLALAEARQTPIQEAWRREVQDAYAKIMGLIRDLLADTLPTDDLETLSQRLSSIGSGPTNLGSLLGQTEDNAATSIDSVRLQRLVTLAKNLSDLAWRLGEGRQGKGRARTSVVLSLRDASAWGLNYPYNPFGGPVILDRTGDAPLLAAGILDGQLHQVSTDLALLRQAHLEQEHPEQAAHLSARATFKWADLSPQEQTRAGQLIVVGDSGLLAGRSLSQLHHLLGMGLPIKVLVLADLGLGVSTPAGLNITAAALPDADSELGLLALAHRDVYIAQSAISFPDHLLPTIEQVLDHPGPALLHMHAPSPSNHGFPSGRTVARTHDAVTCRVLPLFRYDPKREGVFGTRLDLQGNPETDIRTPAHWAMGEERFAPLFSPLAKDVPNPTALEAYLALDPKQQHGRTPYVERGGQDGLPQRLAIAPELVRVCNARLAVWRMLQELAGIVTPFTAKVRQEVEIQVAAKHKAELAAQAADYELKLSSLEAQMREDTRQALRVRLMQLSGYAR